MRMLRDLEPGDHVEHMGFQWVVTEVTPIPEADGAVQDVWSPLVVSDAVWFAAENVPRHQAHGRMEVAVTGCDDCGQEHESADCHRRSI